MERHYERYGHNTKKRKTWRPGRLLAPLDAIVALLTIGAAALLLLGYLAPYINPNTAIIFAFLGLAVPVLLVINLAALLYWVLRWKRMFILPALVLLLGLGKIALIFQPTLGKRYVAEKPRGAITVMSHNVHGFLDMSGKKVFLDSTLTLVASLTPDIVCLQEFQATDRMPRQRSDELLQDLPFSSVAYKMKLEGDNGFGLAIYSRYPIIRSEYKDFTDHSGIVMWADVVCLRDTLRVFNCHFQTTSLDASDRQFVSSAEFMQDTGTSKRRVRSILSKLGQNFRLRAMQADSIAAIIAGSHYNVVVCGDFNDTPISYTYRTVRGRLADSFIDKGMGRTNTYRGFFNLLRIDYIFHSRSYKTLYYAEPPTKWSDHNPVVTTIKKE